MLLHHQAVVLPIRIPVFHHTRDIKDKPCQGWTGKSDIVRHFRVVGRFVVPCDGPAVPVLCHTVDINAALV